MACNISDIDFRQTIKVEYSKGQLNTIDEINNFASKHNVSYGLVQHELSILKRDCLIPKKRMTAIEESNYNYDKWLSKNYHHIMYG